MTMEEIDRLRKDADDAIEYLRALEARIEPCPECGTVAPLFNSVEEGLLLEARGAKRRAEARVDVALREWWAQGCRP
jgi:hypothetical protein